MRAKRTIIPLALMLGKFCGRNSTTVEKALRKVVRAGTSWQRKSDNRNYPKLGDTINSTRAYVEAYYRLNNFKAHCQDLFAPLSITPICYPEGEEVIYSEDPDYVEPAKVKKPTKAVLGKQLAETVMRLNPDCHEVGAGMLAHLQTLAQEILKK